MIDVSIIIVNYNTKKITSECIESIINYTKDISYEIILVDNNSTDGSKELFNSDIRIKYIFNDQNLGFGQANNIGVKNALGKYILLLNSDTLLLNNAPKLMYDLASNNKDIGIVGANLYDINNKEAYSYSLTFPSIKSEFEYTCLFNLYYKLVYGTNRYFNTKDTPFDVSFVSGAALMISKNLYEKINGFDPNFFMYFEETDLEKRIKKLKYKIVNLPSAKVIHLEGKSFSYNPEREALYFESRKKYYIKHFSNNYYKFATFLYKIYIYIGIFVMLFINKEQVKILNNKLKNISNLN